MEGDYNDFYQRPSFAVATSKSRRRLEELWESLKITRRTDELVYREYEGDEYIEYSIAEVPDL
jgi:hypothetical protein